MIADAERGRVVAWLRSEATAIRKGAVKDGAQGRYLDAFLKAERATSLELAAAALSRNAHRAP